MSDKNWTPGPWEVCNSGDIFSALGADSGDGVKADENDGWQVAEVSHYRTSVDGELLELGDAVRKANINLICAAPELYEALEAIMPDRTGYMESMDWQAYHEAVKAARAALKKARGEQP